MVAKNKLSASVVLAVRPEAFVRLARVVLVLAEAVNQAIFEVADIVVAIGKAHYTLSVVVVVLPFACVFVAIGIAVLAEAVQTIHLKLANIHVAYTIACRYFQLSESMVLVILPLADVLFT